jgi:hypothetical protein
MLAWSKPTQPVDRAVADLERQIADLKRKIRSVAAQTASKPDVPDDAPQTESFKKFVKEMLAPPKRNTEPTYRAGLDAGADAETMKQLEPDPIPFARKTEPDLFNYGAKMGQEKSAEPGSRLARYLGAGSIKTYPRLKGEQRRERNRFFMWLGLSFVALWILYVVVR